MNFEEIVERMPEMESKTVIELWWSLQPKETKAAFDALIDFTYSHGARDGAKGMKDVIETALLKRQKGGQG